jgi:radical SAM superfamily enzyme YgiQ (UPF0313 family)
MKAPGAILLIACYELGHQPLAVAWPAAFLERRGYAPAVVDLSIEPLDPDQVRRARLVAISVPMHTALRLGVTVARRVREINPSCHICFYGLYATLNANELLSQVADYVLAGELEDELVGLVQELENSTGDGVGTGGGGEARRANGVFERTSLPPVRPATPAPSRRHVHSALHIRDNLVSEGRHHHSPELRAAQLELR